MQWVKDIDSLYNFIGYVILRAPDRFPKEDFLCEAEQMNLEKAFSELRRGIDFVDIDFPGADVDRVLSRLLDSSFASYKMGDDKSGAHLLQDFQDKIFKR